MALVDYCSEDEEPYSGKSPVIPTSTAEASKERGSNSEEGNPFAELPPLPPKFHDLYASTTRVSTKDDPTLHGGRKRITPHVEGYWPTHVYIEWYPGTTEYSQLTDLIGALKQSILDMEIQSSLISDLGVPLPLHLSLSRPVGFATERKDVFLMALGKAIKTSGVRPFTMRFVGLDWVGNDEKTRWFLVLRVQQPVASQLSKLLHISNHIVQEYGQQPLYAPASHSSPVRRDPNIRAQVPSTDKKDVSESFHISLAWTLKAPNENTLRNTKLVVAERLERIKQLQIKIDMIKIKIGNVVSNIPLQNQLAEGKSLFGT